MGYIETMVLINASRYAENDENYGKCNTCKHYGNCCWCSSCTEGSGYEFDTKGYAEKYADEIADWLGINVTGEMRNLLKKLADLADKASNEVYDDDDEEGTGGILFLCDRLREKIDDYLEKGGKNE